MEKDEHRRDRKPKWWRRFWIEVTIASVVLGAVFFALYFSNYINLYGLLRGIASISFATFFAYIIAYIKIEVLSQKGRLTLYKIAYIVGGASSAIFIILFGVGVILRALNLPSLHNLLGTWPAITLTLVIAPTIVNSLGTGLAREEVSNRHFS